MERPNSNSDLHSLLKAIKSSEVVECQVQLIVKLTELDLPDKSDVALVFDSLTTLWDEFTCLDVSQCLLNKAIIQVASKYVDLDLSGCLLLQFPDLGTKASLWCGKHLKMTLMSSADSQEEEHSGIFFQLLLEFLSLSASILINLTRYPVSTDVDSAVIVERFVLEQLNFTKDVVSEAKRISCGSEVLKAAQMVIDAVIRLCKEYFLAVNWDNCGGRSGKEESSIDPILDNCRNHVINITKCTIENLYKLGILAANDGGSLVTILNVSWKGVVTLLQQGKQVLTDRVCVQDILITLISLVKEPLRRTSMAWSSVEETISTTDCRRTFLPVKFYLINAMKLSTLYPCQALLIYREVAHCVLMISTFRIILSFQKLLNTASQVFSELLEKTSMDFLTSLLNSAEVKQEQKFELLDWLFTDECLSNYSHGDSSSFYKITSVDKTFSANSESVSQDRLLLLGRVALFHTLLRYSVCLEEDIRNNITRKLVWVLDVLVNEEVYSSILDLQIPVAYGSGKTAELVWQPIFSSVVDAIKTFMILVSSTSGWMELEDFLLENLFHPHFLCWEVIMELWCFLLRHAESDMVNNILNKFFSLMKLLASPESVHIPASPLRKIARIICLLLTNGSSSMVDHVYRSVVGDDKSQLSSVMYIALLLEGFPLNVMSDNLRSVAKQKIVTDYFTFIGTSGNKLSTACSSSLSATPVFALSASLQSQQVSISDVDMKSLSFLVTTIRNLKSAVDKPMKQHYHMLLSETLGIISNLKHLYTSDEMEEVILELQNLFISGPAASDPLLYQCKPYLALYMGGLGDMEISEKDDCAKSCAVWELYHMVFKERHWALVHLAIASFGYFAARTSCNELWRFVPQNAALCYDVMSGNDTNVERFMSELKSFLEKETALLIADPSFEQLELLMKEGAVLKEMVQRVASIQIEAMECEETDVDLQSNKRRKLPDGISKGVEILQSGLKVIGDGLSQWQQNQMDSSEHHDKFLTHFSQLQDVITRIISLTDE
ncbi:uncharacterized protein LOC126666641 [Mercurialis annua]|uniref:uncharacterized protein LOC126666641 n=1 Tax=Mercurialis annua TaxID=3986 RepID=UPI00215F3632|nr:uncharacterized protein LOC126666641 [Mercurialis annua]